MTEGDPPATPKIIVPFQRAPDGVACQEIVVYLRPETNGVHAESVLFRVFRTPEWNDQVKLVHLANLPGEFIQKRQVVEQHYAARIEFAQKGAQAFLPSMRQTFSRFFGIPFEKADLIGAFEALDRLGLTEEELFQLWVPVHDILEIEGQLIKKTADNVFIVNYDIPALLHKNHAGTDVASMVFRTTLGYDAFRPAVDVIRQALIREGLLSADKVERRVFHWSKGPFEQLLDAQGYLYDVRDQPVAFSELAFGRFLLDRGWSVATIEDCLARPFQFGANLFSSTLFATFEEAFHFVQSRSPLA
ncbi:MAG: hypothetical protein WCG80_13855 [Spirochaetales bacterium]